MANIQVQNNPVYALPDLYITGLDLSPASSTVIAIAPGQARDSNDVIDMPVGFPNLEGVINPTPQPILMSFPIFIDTTINGVNGLDYGTLAENTFYTIWLIGDSRNYKNTAGIISLESNVLPLMPLGYDSYRLLGFFKTQSDSPTILGSTVIELKNSTSSYFKPNVVVLTGGNATTFTTIDLSSAIPDDCVGTNSSAAIAILLVQFIPAQIGDTVQFRPSGSTAVSNLPTIVGVSANVTQQQYIQVVSGVNAGDASIDYIVSNSLDQVYISVLGYICISAPLV